jgi:hypothetical protein
MEREALKLALEALEEHHYGVAQIIIREALAQDVPETGFGNMPQGWWIVESTPDALNMWPTSKDILLDKTLAQPAQEQWNAALDEAAARIGEIKGFGQATQDSFAVYIKGLKR